jgi:hypothetical protein
MTINYYSGNKNYTEYKNGSIIHNWLPSTAIRTNPTATSYLAPNLQEEAEQSA